MIGNEDRRGRDVEIFFNEGIFSYKEIIFFINLINGHYKYSN